MRQFGKRSFFAIIVVTQFSFSVGVVSLDVGLRTGKTMDLSHNPSTPFANLTKVKVKRGRQKRGVLPGEKEKILYKNFCELSQLRTFALAVLVLRDI